MDVISGGLIKSFALLLIPIGVISWLLVLARTSSRTALMELQSHTTLLTTEINAHQKTSLALEQAKRSAETANNAKSRYLASLSHELRTPLNILLGYAQLLRTDQTSNQQTRDYADVLKRNGKHLSDMIEGLLEISKIEAGRLELHRDEFSLTALLDQLVDMFSMQAKRKGLEFEYEVSGYLPKFVAADKQRLRQILINLLGNAVKYTEQGKITFKVRYRNQVVHFSVQDTGIGLSEQDLELIFKPFERIKNQKTMAINGSGLGLTISNALAELMGGEISCTSQVNYGSAFVLKLMLPEVLEGTVEPEVLDDTIIGYSGKRQTILVVDDIDDQRQLIARILQPLGFNVLTAENAPQALKMVKTHHIDLFLLDIFMPQMNGWQLAIQLRKEHYRQPIMMLSANIQELEIHNQLARYHNDYLTKPVSVPMLLAKLYRLLDIEWLYEEEVAPEEKNPEALDDPEAAQTNPTPSYQQLVRMREYAAIGFLSAVSNELETMIQMHAASDDWLSELKQNLQECNFNNIIAQIDGLINEHYNNQ
ncbi:ATP-binding protein [Vibrio mytili]|nr:ATP-binding protein [Vibrio mytili]